MDTCPLGEVAQVMQYLAGESAGQCGPCRLGLPDLARAVTLVAAGSAARWRACARRPAWSRAAARAATRTARPGSRSPRWRCSPTTSRRTPTATGCGKQVRGILPLPYHAEQGARKLAVDWSRCDGHGLCAHVVPEIIRLDANGFPAFPQTPVPPWLESGARKAVNVSRRSRCASATT